MAKSIAVDSRSTDGGINAEINKLYTALKTDGNAGILDDYNLNYIKGDTLYQGANLAAMFRAMASVLGDEVFSSVYDLGKLGIPDSVAKLIEGDYYTLYAVMRDGSTITSAVQIDFKEYSTGKFMFKLAQYNKMNGVSELHFSYYDSESVAFVATMVGNIGTDFASYDENYDSFSVTECRMVFFDRSEYVLINDGNTIADENILKFAKNGLDYDNQTYLYLAGLSGGKSLSDAEANGIYTEMSRNVYENPYLNPDDKKDPSGGGETVELESITIPSEAQVEIGESIYLTITVSPANASFTLRWASSDERVARVDNNEVTGVSVGTAIVTVTSDNGKTASCKVTVAEKKGPEDTRPGQDTADVERVLLNPPQLEMKVGETCRLDVDIFPHNAKYDKIEWSSSNDGVATVDDNGQVTAVAEGRAIVTVTVSGKSAACGVIVESDEEPFEITISPDWLELTTGDRQKLTAEIRPAHLAEKYSVTWSSSDDEYVTVDGEGNVTAVAAGVSIITATAGGKSAICTVFVNPVFIESIEFENETTTIEVGQTALLKLVIRPADAKPQITWSSSAPDKVSVDGEGNVTALSNGSAMITAQTDGDMSAHCRVQAVGFEFAEITENGSVVSYAVSVGSMGEMSPMKIPAQYNGKPVTHIADYGFQVYQGTEIILPDSITHIGNYAFNGCPYLTDINIPSRVVIIGESAFRSCESLAKITIPASVETVGECAFWYCSEISEIVIQNGVKRIGDYAFYYCYKLTEIVIPDSVERIGSNAFEWCRNLESITLPFVGEKRDGTTGFSYIFGENPVSMRRVTVNGGAIRDYSFNSYYQLTSIVLGEGVTSIGDYAFFNCTMLTGIVVPDSVTRIGYAAFKYCNALESLSVPFVGETKAGSGNAKFIYFFDGSIPDSLKNVTIRGGEIADEAFWNCGYLETVVVSDAVTRIGFGAFGYCNSLAMITLPFVGETMDCEENNHFGYIFGAERYSDSGKMVPSSLSYVRITGGTVLQTYSFAYCQFATLILPKSIAKIETSVFFQGGASNIFYEGSKADWANVQGATMYYSVYYYSETQPADDGKYWHYAPNGVNPIVW